MVTSSIKETLLVAVEGLFRGMDFWGRVKDHASPHRDVRPCTNSVVRTVATPKLQSLAVSPFRLAFRPTIVVYQLPTATTTCSDLSSVVLDTIYKTSAHSAGSDTSKLYKR